MLDRPPVRARLLLRQESDLAEERSNSKTLEKRIGSLSRELQAFIKRRERLEDDVEALERAESKLTRELGRARTSLAETKRALMTANQRGTRLESENRSLNTAIARLRAEKANLSRISYFVLQNNGDRLFLEWAVVVERLPSGELRVNKHSYVENNNGWYINRGGTHDLGRGVFALAYVEDPNGNGWQSSYRWNTSGARTTLVVSPDW